MKKITVILYVSIGIIFISSIAVYAFANPSRNVDWNIHNPQSTSSVDHSTWQHFLQKFLDSDHSSGVNRVRYNQVTSDDKDMLDRYVMKLGTVDVLKLSRDEQMAYWINLYNALTVKVILDYYPVESIRDIKLPNRFLSIGPWGAPLITVQGVELSLNDIEHTILRPIWNDNRIHYAVNCASIGCPNLQPVPYTGKNLTEQLERAAREFINHDRAVKIEDGMLYLSSIYKWYKSDFGATEGEIIAHIKKYAAPKLKKQLDKFDGRIRYHYNWDLNE